MLFNVVFGLRQVGLLATRRGWLRDYFEAVAALGPGDAAAAARPACCTAERARLLTTLREIAVGQYLGAERAADAAAGVAVGSVVTLGLGVIVALSPCATAHALHTRFTKIIGTSFSETAMRPNPR